MADEDLFREFQEFLSAKKKAESDEREAEDFEVELWDKDGRGVRTKRSHAKPFLQSLGIDLDPEPDDEGDTGDTGGKKEPAKKKPAPKPPVNTVRKYFGKQ